MSIRYVIICISFSFLMSTTFPISYHCWCILHCFLCISIQLHIYLFICIFLSSLLYPQLCLSLSFPLSLSLSYKIFKSSYFRLFRSLFLYISDKFIYSVITDLNQSNHFSYFLFSYSVFFIFPFPYSVFSFLLFQLILLLSIFPLFLHFLGSYFTKIDYSRLQILRS